MENLKKISIEEKKFDKRIYIIYKKRKKNFVLFYNSFILLLFLSILFLQRIKEI